ncbi:hypothetical protein IAQ61_011578 [Plenodomus lingam]|nr:hypothetical protein IAQ61_011578 [Plenodomus lingam]
MRDRQDRHIMTREQARVELRNKCPANSCFTSPLYPCLVSTISTGAAFGDLSSSRTAGRVPDMESQAQCGFSTAAAVRASCVVDRAGNGAAPPQPTPQQRVGEKRRWLDAYSV